MHVHEIEDEHGDLADVVPFCSDACHREWCAESSAYPYAGWNGAREGGDANEYCANCGVIASCGEGACEHQRDNVVVNRFTSQLGIACDHGNWIQLPGDLVNKR